MGSLQSGVGGGVSVGVVFPRVLYGLGVDGFATDDSFDSGDDFGNDDWYGFVALNIGHGFGSGYGSWSCSSFEISI